MLDLPLASIGARVPLSSSLPIETSSDRRERKPESEIAFSPDALQVRISCSSFIDPNFSKMLMISSYVSVSFDTDLAAS